MNTLTINYDDKVSNTLVDSVSMMLSTDYKDRFLAEYNQLKYRYQGLLNMLKQWDDGQLAFTPTCPRATYNFQVRAMKDYLDILEIRAKIENISLV